LRKDETLEQEAEDMQFSSPEAVCEYQHLLYFQQVTHKQNSTSGHNSLLVDVSSQHLELKVVLMGVLIAQRCYTEDWTVKPSNACEKCV
jgi:hypothetical protein